MLVRKDAGDTYDLAKIVALKTFLVAHIDDPVIRAVVRYKPMYRKTLLKRMIMVASVVDVKIMHELLGEKCALGFDGFTDTADHAIAVFAASKNDIRLLAFFPFLDEASMAAAVHIEFLDMVLDRYNLAIHSMVAIVADNMEIKKAISRRISIPLMGYAAHRFHLAVPK
ncbi:hypothetical protein GN958_ATG14292 [Phytophthora infestans]|uniref:Uncharacterized protein n=1 Tax=Phytophthora infestans TaxID=4787 RepID=A0A8S9U510_PHYIN|nr:hypothetical protein GN958_ATG15998 [Phytophthora infestans]KAF4136522.1 hypothetical protein GN958_ATG14292 [Phytophthora infestans]